MLIFKLRIRASGSSLFFFFFFPGLACCLLPAAFAAWHGVVVNWRTVGAQTAGLSEVVAVRSAGEDTCSLEKRLFRLRGDIFVELGVINAVSPALEA